MQNWSRLSRQPWFSGRWINTSNYVALEVAIIVKMGLVKHSSVVSFIAHCGFFRSILEKQQPRVLPSLGNPSHVELYFGGIFPWDKIWSWTSDLPQLREVSDSHAFWTFTWQSPIQQSEDDTQRIYMLPLHRSNRESCCHPCLLNHLAEFGCYNMIFLLTYMTVQLTGGEIIIF